MKEMKKERRVTLKGLLWLTFLLPLIILLIGNGIARSEERKVTICHYPPGNQENPQTITVSENALVAHLTHGDQLGECPTGCQANDSICDDANACTSDACLSNGQCEHILVNCDDDNPCTTDQCEATTGCLNVPDNGTPCDDGNACTSADTCSNGNCRGAPVLGCCVADADCDDGNPCTTDACFAHTCSNQPLDCSVDDKCLVGFCDPNIGICDTVPVDCNDSNECTLDSCDSTVGCVHVGGPICPVGCAPPDSCFTFTCPGGCNCSPTTEGPNVCVVPTCSNAVPCISSADCSPGNVCSTLECCGEGSFCVPIAPTGTTCSIE